MISIKNTSYNGLFVQLTFPSLIYYKRKKKVSIPGTISRGLKYIPKLQKEVDTLKRKKEKLSSHPTTSIRKEHLGVKEQSAKVSVNILGDKEVVILTDFLN
ncbi:hypothetical protein Hanom_Chr01g00032701 [Helianthus anomalus]